MLRIPIDGAGFEPAAVGRRFAERYRARFDIELPGVGVTLKRKLAKLGLSAHASGDGLVVAQEPEPGTALEQGGVCRLVLQRSPKHQDAPGHQ